MDAHRDADLTLGPCLDPDCPTGQHPGPGWLTYVQAAELIGCSKTTIAAMVRDGRLVGRHPTVLSTPSIDAASARAVRDEWAAASRVREERRRITQARRPRPPGDGDVWLRTSTAAAVLGITPTRLRQRAHAGRTPFAWHDNRMWFRRSDIEVRAAVVAFRERPPSR